MINNTKIKISKKYEPMIDEVVNETFGGNGYWIYLKKGFRSTSTGCHCIHEYTQTELLKELKTIVKCNCDKCTEE